MGALEHPHLLAPDAISADCLSDDDGEEIEEVLDRGLGSRSELTRPIEDAVKVLLQGLGEDYTRDGLRKTPLRVAKAFRDATRGYKQKVNDIVQGALFPEAGPNTGKGLAGGVGGLVVVRDINLYSSCESCLLPFRVCCHVAYVPSGERVVGLSKLARVADVFARRLQSPQRLADEICSALQSSIKPAGVAVVVQCWHIQFPESFNINFHWKCPSKSEMQGWLHTQAYSSSGVLSDENSSFWADFVSLLKYKGVDIEKSNRNFSSVQAWCFPDLSVPSSNGHGPGHAVNLKANSRQSVSESSMIAATTSLLQAIGEDPRRKELAATPYRFVRWMNHFKKAVFDMKTNSLKENGVTLRSNGVIQGDGKKIHYELSLSFCAQCEHHLLPFYGVVHVAYFHTVESEPLERASLQSIVHFYGCKLQVQERLTRQVAETVSSIFGRGVMVVVEASHTCMLSRGIEKIGSSTATVAVIGEFAMDSEAKAKFMQNISESIAFK